MLQVIVEMQLGAILSSSLLNEQTFYIPTTSDPVGASFQCCLLLHFPVPKCCRMTFKQLLCFFPELN